MQTVLDSAHTWFLESCTQQPSGGLVVRLVEGIKGTERQPVDIGETVLGPYFPVTIEAHSRCALVYFSEMRGLFTYNESYDAKDPELKVEDGRFLRRVEASSFRKFASETTTAIDSFRGRFVEYLIWCEDQIFQVLASADPEVSLVDSAPDLSIERGRTWSAS